MIYLTLGILVAITITIFVVYKTSMPVDVVLAGDINKESDVTLKRKVTIFDFFFCNGKIINPTKYMVLVVGGNSMAKKGLEKRDLIFVDRFNNDNERINALRKGDIILLKVHEHGAINEGKLKVREFISFIDSEKIQTMSYDNGTYPRLSRPHIKSNIIGKVLYKMKY